MTKDKRLYICDPNKNKHCTKSGCYWLGNGECCETHFPEFGFDMGMGIVTREGCGKCELIRKRDKYKWHDLRMDPDDLPKDDERKLVCIEWQSGEREYYTDYFYRNHWCNDNVSINGTIIAWKDIEPFGRRNDI